MGLIYIPIFLFFIVAVLLALLLYIKNMDGEGKGINFKNRINLRKIKIGGIVKYLLLFLVALAGVYVITHFEVAPSWYDSSRISVTGGDDTDIDSQSLIFQGDTEEWDMLSEVEKQKYLVFVDTKNEKIKVFSRGDDRMTQAKITLPRENVGFTLKYEIDGSGGILFEASDISDSNAYPNLERSTSNSEISYYEYHISDTRWKVIGGNDYFEESYASTCDREGRSMIPSITLSPSYSQEMTIEKRSFFS